MLSHSKNTDTYIYIYMDTQLYKHKHMYAHPISISISEILSRLDLEIHEVGHQEHLAVNRNVASN
jgi:hypothetical protein